MLRKKQIEANN